MSNTMLELKDCCTKLYDDVHVGIFNPLVSSNSEYANILDKAINRCLSSISYKYRFLPSISSKFTNDLDENTYYNIFRALTYILLYSIDHIYSETAKKVSDQLGLAFPEKLDPKAIDVSLNYIPKGIALGDVRTYARTFTIVLVYQVPEKYFTNSNSNCGSGVIIHMDLQLTLEDLKDITLDKLVSSTLIRTSSLVSDPKTTLSNMLADTSSKFIKDVQAFVHQIKIHNWFV